MNNTAPRLAPVSLGAYVLMGAVLGIFYRFSQIPSTRQFCSTAKVVASPSFRAFKHEDNGITDYDKSTLTSFADTIVETLESAELFRNAVERVHALNPELEDSAVSFSATQLKESAIFSISARGPDDIYVRTVLNALLDEFVAFRQSIRSRSQARYFKVLFDEFEGKRVASSKLAQPEERERLEAAYQTLFERLGEYKTNVEDTSDVAIYARASSPLSEEPDMAAVLGWGIGLGVVLGIVAWCADGTLRSLASANRRP